LRDRAARRPKLITIDGIRQTDLVAAAKRLLRQEVSSRGGGISVWDASGVFFELSRAKKGAGLPSAKTLLMLYASDLEFRLRWEIRPALADGQAVVATPYVETAVAFGHAAGVPRAWLKNLFSFAPSPDAAYRLPESNPLSCWTGRKMAGFVEFGCATLAAVAEDWTPTELIAGALGELAPRLPTTSAAIQAGQR
jgi:hypothetical protein